MTLTHYAGAVVVLLFITALGWYSGSRVKTAADFSTGGKRAGAGIVAGTITGTLVGGASTIGTAQLAFTYGLSAWWYTLGGGIACLILGFVYAKPLHASGCATMPQILSREFGQRVATTAAILTSMGNFLSIISQVLSSVALVTSFAAMPSGIVTLLTIALMIAYVIFGGVWSTGIVGIAKVALLCASVGLCGLAALYWQGGLAAFFHALPAERYFSLVARGIPKDMGAALSMIIGMLTTQTYVQAIISARTVNLAKTGAYASALLIPSIGAAGILVGLYMRVHFPDIVPATALPLFILTFVPPLFSGMVMAILFVAVVGTAAGVSLGLCSVLCNDIYCVYANPRATDRQKLLASRLILAGILIVAGLVAVMHTGSLILGWSILSMALRGIVGFGVLTAALFFPGRIPSGYALVAMLAGPACFLGIWLLMGDRVDPLSLGLLASILILLAGYRRKKDEKEFPAK